MRKVFITYCDYPEGHQMRVLYEKHTKPRFIEYSNIHGFEFIEIDRVTVPKTHNFGFSKVYWIQQRRKEFNDGDIITYMDIDCCIVDGRIPAVFDADFSIVRETCGLLCMGGTWSLRISDWSREFLFEMCSAKRQFRNKDTKFWNTWHENAAVYDVLGLEWEAEMETMGNRSTTTFTKSELIDHVKVLPSKWGVTYNPYDVNFTIPYIYKDKRNKNRNPNRTYEIISTFAKPELICPSNEIIVRHLSARTMRLDWAYKYYNKKMIV